MNRKWFAAILLLVAVCACGVALADDTDTNGPYTYSVKDDGTIIITKFSWSQNKKADVYIPSMIDGYTVTEIGEEAFAKGCYTTGNYGYSYRKECDIKVVLPDTVTRIGGKAFFDAGITEINIPESVQYIGPAAFSDCQFLHFIVSKTHPYFAVIDKALYSKKDRELLWYPYFYLEKTDLVIPEGIVSIGDYALYRCYSYDNPNRESHRVVLPSTLKHIGNYAFSSGIFEIGPGVSFLPEGLEDIGESAFYRTEFYAYARQDAVITFPSSLVSIGKKCFQESKTRNYVRGATGSYMVTVVIPADTSITVIPYGAFQDCDMDIRLYADSLERIEDYGFSTDYFYSDGGRWGHHGILYPCDSQGNIDYGVFRNVEYIGKYGLSHKDKTKNECVVAGGDPSGFRAKITEINSNFDFPVLIPSSVQKIAANAYTNAVMDYYLPETLSDISPQAFPRGSTFVVEAGSYAEHWAAENVFEYAVIGVSEEDDLSWLNGE